MGLRRLMDKEKNGLYGKRGVYSLWALLDDVGRHSHLLVRDAIIRLGPPQKERCGEVFRHDWACTKNQFIDELVGVSDAKRSPHDRIPQDLFDTRRKTLEGKFANAENLINKEIAHPATPDSRRGFNYQEILWGDLYDFHAELCKTAHFLQDIISESGMNSFLRPFQGDELQYLSRPMVAEPDFQKLADRWAKLEGEYKSWRSWRRTEKGSN